MLSWDMSVETYDSLRGTFSIIGAIVMMLMHIDYNSFLIVIIIIYLLGYYISQSYFLMVIFKLISVFFYKLYSLTNTKINLHIVLIVIGLIVNERYLLITYVFARLVCYITINIIGTIRKSYYYQKYGVYLGNAEVTAAKLIFIYTDKRKNFEQWMNEYSESSMYYDIKYGVYLSYAVVTAAKSMRYYSDTKGMFEHWMNEYSELVKN
jgi:hypothetical protein